MLENIINTVSESRVNPIDGMKKNRIKLTHFTSCACTAIQLRHSLWKIAQLLEARIKKFNNETSMFYSFGNGSE